MREKRKDAWTPAFIILSAITTVIFVLIAQANVWLVLLIVIIIPFVSVAILICLFHDLVRSRIRHAFSIVIAIVSALGITYHAPMIALGKAKLAFFAHQAEFERQVEEARTKQTTQEPLQIVVDYEDQSIFVTANLFYYLIYDETDGAGPYKADFWPYAKSQTGMIAVSVPERMQHLAGHFYSFHVSF